MTAKTKTVKIPQHSNPRTGTWCRFSGCDSNADGGCPSCRHLGIAPGAVVRHSSPELADWEGVIRGDRNGNWSRRESEARVQWTAGTDGAGGPLADCKPCWMPVSVLVPQDQDA
jgi:hypothetical protein